MYLDTIGQKRAELDRLVARYSVHIVGDGYIDIIVTRDRCFDFINELTGAGLVIEAVSWWCHATDQNKRVLGCPHGYGGPMTAIGWFSELSHDFDELTEEEMAGLKANDFHNEVTRINNNMIETIRCKVTLPLADGTSLRFSEHACLTPGIWVHVPEDWKR